MGTITIKKSDPTKQLKLSVKASNVNTALDTREVTPPVLKLMYENTCKLLTYWFGIWGIVVWCQLPDENLKCLRPLFQMWKSLFFSCTGLSPTTVQMNHPEGTFYWHDYLTAEISQPPANSFTPYITHTFKVFIIKSIRVCSFNIFPPWSPFQGSAWLRFISTQPQRDWLFCWLSSHPPPGRRCFFVSWFSAAIITDSVSLAAL